MSEESTGTTILSGVVSLLCIPVVWWLDAHLCALAWNGVLRHYLTDLPALTTWQAWVVGAAGTYLFSHVPLESREDDREYKSFIGLRFVALSAARYAALWLMIRYIVEAA